MSDTTREPVAILSWEQADQIMQDQRAEIARLRLTDAEREVLSDARDDFEADGFAAHAAVIDGLLSRATKEGGR
jgi:hypothetical protein